MNLKALQSLVAIYETESFLEAAKRLGFNQSSVSMQMKALEEELGATLFDRTVRPPAMTAAAVAIIRPAREILLLAETIREAVKTPVPLAGELALGAIHTATISLLPDSVVSINKRYPSIQIRVQSGLSGVLIENVRAGILDAAIVTEPAEIENDLQSEIIFRERLALASSIVRGPPPTLDDLRNSNFIRFNRRVGVGQIIDRYLTKKEIHPAEFMELDSIDAILAMVERGIGIAIVPERTLEPYRQRVMVRPLDDVEAARNVSFIFRANSQKRSLLEAVLASFRQTLTSR